MCAGIVKGAKVYPKNPAQHYSDITMLTETPTFRSVFHYSFGSSKKMHEWMVPWMKGSPMRKYDFGGQQGILHKGILSHLLVVDPVVVAT